MPSLPRIVAAPYPSNFGAVAEFMRPRVRAFYEGKAWIHVIDPTTITTSLDHVTGTQTVNATPEWSGWARVQPLRNTVSTWRASNPTTTRIVQFWVDDPETITFDFRPGLRIAVDGEVAGDNNDPNLANYLYVTVGAINSTQAWQRTIDTQVDLENRPKYDTSGWPKPGDFTDTLVFGDGFFGEYAFGQAVA